MRILLLKNYPDIARCCYYEYHYLWQVVRVLNFWCQPIRDQDNGNWPIRGKSSLCCDKCWQWAASFLQPEQNTSKGQNESLLLFHQTWHEPIYVGLWWRIFQYRSRWRLTRNQESCWCQVLLFSLEWCLLSTSCPPHHHPSSTDADKNHNCNWEFSSRDL